MILVDTSVWALYFNGDDGALVERLENAFDIGEDVVTAPIIITETLQGFRTEQGFAKAKALLVQLPCLGLDVEGHVAAARLFRNLRQKGVTVRGAVDCILAQTAIQHGAGILARDRDFERIARHVPLRIVAGASI